MIKSVLLDIDGTLTNDEKVITPRTREALLKIQDAGVRLALASGRPDMGLYRFAKELQMDTHHGIFICYNGARVVDCQSGEELFSQSLSAEEAKAVLRHLQKFAVTPIIAKGEYMHTTDVFGCVIEYRGAPFNVVEYESRGNQYILCEHRDLAEWVDFPVEKILTAAAPTYLQEHSGEMQEPFADTLSCMFTGDFYFEYTAKGVNKAKAIEEAYRRLGISREEMMAFGDAENDLPMIEYVGCGVAMANGADAVKEAADEVTLDNNHDGIAESIYRHFPDIWK
ncbi:MAG: HAD family phosphatase [Lachnospiraceae bacterium]|nr:HAD family phosphatase [Lachnospiraceae bacterium]